MANGEWNTVRICIDGQWVEIDEKQIEFHDDEITLENLPDCPMKFTVTIHGDMRPLSPQESIRMGLIRYVNAARN